MKQKKNFINNLVTYLIVILAFLFCKLVLSGEIEGLKMSRSLKGQLIPICVYIVMAVSLNLTVGISGELSLGHAGFMSIGAYTGIVISQWIGGAYGGSELSMMIAEKLPNFDMKVVRLIAALISGGIAAGIAGFLIGIPVLRLRGDYLAIVTLAFGEIIRSVINCLYVSVEGGTLHTGFMITGMLPGKRIISGPMNTSGIEKLATFEAGFIMVLFALFVVLNLINSRSGRAIMASRDNRIAAESMGVNVTKYKMIAFVTSAALAGIAGALYGLNTSIEPKKFNFDTSIEVLVFVVLGGIGSIRGSVIAAALLTILPEVLREFGNYRMLAYAIVLILVMLARNSIFVRTIISSARNTFKNLFKFNFRSGSSANQGGASS